MIESGYIVAAILAMAFVTFALRALPFVAAQWLRKHPIVDQLGEFLPLAIMTLLTVHSAAGSATEHAGWPWPEALAIALVAILQWKRRNALLSILAGTCVYVMIRNSGMV